MAVSALLEVPGGYVQDRFDRRKTVIVGALAGVVLYAVAALVVAVGALTVTSAVLIAVAQGLRSGLTGTGPMLMLRSIMPADKLPGAIGAAQGRDAVVELAGAPLGGVLLQVSQAFPFVGTCLLNLLAGVAAFRLPSDRPVSTEGTQGFRSVFAGIALVSRDQFLRVTTVFGNLLMAIFNAALMISVLDLVDRGAPAATAALLNSSVAIGVFAGAALVGLLMSRVRGGILLAAAFSLPVISVLGMAASDSVWVRIAWLMPAMILLPVGNSASSAFQMVIIPHDILGRAYAGFGLAEMAVSALVTATAGLGLERFGYGPTMLIGGALMLLCLVSLLSLRTIRDIPLPSQYESYARSRGYSVVNTEEDGDSTVVQ